MNLRLDRTSSAETGSSHKIKIRLQPRGKHVDGAIPMPLTLPPTEFVRVNRFRKPRNSNPTNSITTQPSSLRSRPFANEMHDERFSKMQPTAFAIQ